MPSMSARKMIKIEEAAGGLYLMAIGEFETEGVIRLDPRLLSFLCLIVLM